MERPETLMRLLLDLPEPFRLALLREAGIYDDRPDLLRRGGGLIREAQEWVAKWRPQLGRLVLRYVDPTDEAIAGLVADGDLPPPLEMRPLRLVIRFGRSDGSAPPDSGLENAVPLSDLAIYSALLVDLHAALAGANRACGLETPTASVGIASGSVQVTVGGGLLATGLGLILSCSAGLIAAPMVGPLIGATLAVVGAVETIFGLRKTDAETRKLYAESSKFEAERRLVDLEIEQKHIELEQLRLKHELRGHPDAMPSLVLPASSQVPLPDVTHTALNIGVSETYATHVLNRALPALQALKGAVQGEINVEGHTTKKL